MIRIDRQKAFDTARECPTRCAIIQVGYTYALYACYDILREARAVASQAATDNTACRWLVIDRFNRRMYTVKTKAI